MRAAALGEDRGIDADQESVHVDERAARIAGIDGGIGLDEELIVGDADLRAGKRRDDAARHRLPDAERIADGEHDVADFQTVGIAEADRGKLDAVRVEAKHRKIGLFVLEDRLRRKLPPVGKRDGDFGLPAPLDDMVVGDDDTVGADEHAGAERILDALARDAETLAEQPAEERIVEEWGDHLLDPMAHIDVDHRGRRSLHHWSKRLLQRDRALRHRALSLDRDDQGKERGQGEERPRCKITQAFCHDCHFRSCPNLMGPRVSYNA